MTALLQGARTLSSLFSSFLFGAALAAQQFAAGIDHHVASLPPGSGAVCVLAANDAVWFDGQRLWRQQANPAKPILQLPAPAFWSFTIRTDAGHVLFGENTTGTLWLVPLNGPVPTTPLCTIPFHYDAALLSPGKVVLSTRPGGFSGGSCLVLLDLATAQRRTLAAIPGASGPVAVAANGDLFYATASTLFPTPPGLTSILRFPRAIVDQAILVHGRLLIGDAIVVQSGLDTASDLCFDDDDDLLFADWLNNTIGELNDATGPSPWLGAPLASYGLLPGAAMLQFAPASGTGVFEPFQPARGTLFVHETDYFSTSSIRALRAARPELAVPVATPVPSGPFAVQVQRAPASAFGLLAIAIGTAGADVELALPGSEGPLVWNPTAAAVMVPFAVDAQGDATIAAVNPGFTPATLISTQAAFVTANGSLASTAPSPLLLGP